MSNQEERAIVAQRLLQPRFYLYAWETNIPQIIDAVYQNQVEPEQLWADHSIDDVISRCASDSGFRFGPNNESYIKIEQNPTTRAKLDAVYQHFHPRFVRCDSNDLFIIEGAFKHRIRFETENLINMIVENDSLFKSLAVSNEHKENIADIHERLGMLAALTNNGTSNFIVDRKTYDTKGFEIQFSSSGGRRKVDGDGGFDDWTDEQVAYAYDVVMRTRRLKGMNVTDLRKHAHKEGVRRFEERFHVNPETNIPTKLNKKLIDPRTGQPFVDKAQLVSFINSFGRGEGVARLVVVNGKIDPDLGAEFDRLINS